MLLYSLQNNSTIFLSHVKKNAVVEFSTLYIIGNMYWKYVHKTTMILFFVYKREDNSFIYMTNKRNKSSENIIYVKLRRKTYMNFGLEFQI